MARDTAREAARARGEKEREREEACYVLATVKRVACGA